MNYRAALILILIVIIIAAGFFIWNRSQSVVFEGEPGSPVLVDIITPSNGTSIDQGDNLSILAQAWSPNQLASMQLWVDGEMLAAENLSTESAPLKFSWDWEAGVQGVHSMYVKAIDAEGEEGQSQTLLINVGTGGFSQVSAAEGQSLTDLGAQLGVSVPDLQAANPGLDPQLPLSEGQPVILPPSPITGGEETSDDDGLPAGPELVIKWHLTPLEEVDQSYCYQSLGGDIWQKTPFDPFSFFPDDEWLQSILPTQQQLNLQMECWGWQGGTLKYLGEGQTNLDFAQIPEELIIAGSGFQLDGLPEQKPLGLTTGEIPAPFALREAQSVEECSANHWVSLSWCQTFIDSSPKQYNVFIWEWSPGFCWGTCPWGDHIDGYLFAELDPSTLTELSVKQILDEKLKATAAPLPWGSRCYSVSAYVDTTDGRKVSDAAIYCGEQPEPETMVMAPSHWLSSEGMWINEDCDNWADASRLKPTGSQLVVGFFLFADDDYCDIKQGSATAAVKFNNVVLPLEAVLQRATLRFDQVDVAYGFPFDVAVNYLPGSCATRVGKADSDWTTLSSGHYINPDVLTPYYSSYASAGSPWVGEKSIDVTSAVLGWLENASTNHGFVLISDPADLVNSFIFESGWDQKICYSLYDNVELEVQYFAPN